MLEHSEGYVYEQIANLVTTGRKKRTKTTRRRCRGLHKTCIAITALTFTSCPVLSIDFRDRVRMALITITMASKYNGISSAGPIDGENEATSENNGRV